MLSESGTRLWEEQHKKVLWLTDPYQKRAVKCQLAFWPEDYVNHLRLVYTARYVERKPGLNKSQGCWCCIILFYPWISMYNQKYKKPFWTIKDGPVSQTSFSNWFLGNLAPPVSLSFSLSLRLLFRLNSHLECGGSPSLLTCPGF